MVTEFISDKIPAYIHNKHTNYENTVLSEHSSMVGALKDTATFEALIEAQGRLFIGMCMPGKADAFINDKYDSYYATEVSKLTSNPVVSERKQMANTRTWLKLINEAADYYIKKYKIDGSVAKIAVIDNVLPDGRLLMDCEDVPQPVKDYFKTLDITKKSPGPLIDEAVEFTEDEDGI
jgi:hypothetical protein